MAADIKGYRLKIRRDGEVWYLCTDGRFRVLNAHSMEEPELFRDRREAEDAFFRWAKKNPATARGWFYETEEAY